MRRKVNRPRYGRHGSFTPLMYSRSFCRLLLSENNSANFSYDDRSFFDNIYEQHHRKIFLTVDPTKMRRQQILSGKFHPTAQKVLHRFFQKGSCRCHSGFSDPKKTIFIGLSINFIHIFLMLKFSDKRTDFV